MATIADNVLDLAMLVKSVKRQTQLSEATIMRVVDMTFALAQQNQNQPSFTNFDPSAQEASELIDFPMPEPPEADEATTDPEEN